MPPRIWLAALAIAVLAGCSAKVVRVEMDPTRLAAPVPIKLACAYRLGAVVDARPEGDQAGGLSQHAFRFADAPDVVRQQLATAGFAPESDQHAPVVTVRIAQLYLAQSHVTKIPVAVYQVAVGNEPPFVLRSQKASMNWNGTENEAYAAYSRAVADINQQMVGELNRRCSGDRTALKH